MEGIQRSIVPVERAKDIHDKVNNLPEPDIIFHSPYSWQRKDVIKVLHCRTNQILHLRATTQQQKKRSYRS
jgi:hypothetical protein